MDKRIDFRSHIPAIAIRDVYKEVTTAAGSLTILSAISLEIKRAESVAIVGVSGSGKSTLLGLMAGLDSPSQGVIELAGNCISDMDEDSRAQVRAHNVGFVFQTFQLLGSLTAHENVMLPLELDGRADAYEQAQLLLERVGLEERLSHYPKQLSGGEQQRVAIARAFAMSPTILFADEPTGNLDAVTGERIIQLLFELNREQGATLVLVTHDEQLATRCDRRLHLQKGQLIQPALEV